jgi:hypothetical protein
MKDILQLCVRLLEDPDLKPEQKAAVRRFAYLSIQKVLRGCGGNDENFDYQLR